jgi:ribosomal protein S18 acetylase RimI-like enzyme
MTDGTSLDDRSTIRAATPADVAAIRALALDTKMFEPDDMEGFDGQLQGYLDGTVRDQSWVVATGSDGAVEGAAYYAPEPFGDRVWNLYFLAVAPSAQGRRVGTSLIRHVEHALIKAGEDEARLLIVETSSRPSFARARHLYAREGFDTEAMIREFYGPDDHNHVFWKSLV